MSEQTEPKKKPITLKELVVLFMESVPALPDPFDKFASKLAVLTRHVMRIDQKLNVIDKILAQMTTVMMEMKKSTAEQPTEQQAQAQPEGEQLPADAVEDAYEAAKKEVAARAKAKDVEVSEGVVVPKVHKLRDEQAAS